jgi:predicted kinase
MVDDFFTGDFDGLDYDALHSGLAWVRAMAGTPQDARYHAEGDVWTHTRMVCDALVRDAEWPALDAGERRVMLTAALLHDAGKPEVTFTDANGRIRSPEHALRGETLARRVLWEAEEPFAFREEVAALVRHHMQPRYLMEQRDPRRRTYAISHVVRCDRLAMLARADTRGRIAPDHETALRAIGRFVRFCRDHHCLTRPRSFSSDQTRFLYFRGVLDDPDALSLPPDGAAMIVMSGLPGSGKDTWIGRHAPELPVVSLDEIRLELGVAPADVQQPVVQLARERATRLLQQRESFVWNATTLSRQHRRSLLDMAAPFDPHVHAVYLEAPPSLLLPRNRARSGSAAVPDDVIRRMSRIWQPPDCTEVHALTRVLHPADTGARMAS